MNHLRPTIHHALRARALALSVALACALAGCIGTNLEFDAPPAVRDGAVGTGTCMGTTQVMCATQGLSGGMCRFGCTGAGGGGCQGTATCSLASNASACGNALGCQWNGASCYGDAIQACDAAYQTQGLCSLTPGCVWGAVTGCSGSPAPCSTYDFDSCLAAPGCEWGF